MATRGAVYNATRKAIRAAELDDTDAGAVAALLELARQVDAHADDAFVDGEGKPKVDNVTLPTYLRYCESLGLTPAGRARLKPKERAAGGKLAQLRSISKAG